MTAVNINSLLFITTFFTDLESIDLQLDLQPAACPHSAACMLTPQGHAQGLARVLHGYHNTSSCDSLLLMSEAYRAFPAMSQVHARC